jgi:hypothetical protein
MLVLVFVHQEMMLVVSMVGEGQERMDEIRAVWGNGLTRWVNGGWRWVTAVGGDDGRERMMNGSDGKRAVWIGKRAVGQWGMGRTAGGDEGQ